MVVAVVVEVVLVVVVLVVVLGVVVVVYVCICAKPRSNFTIVLLNMVKVGWQLYVETDA